MLEIDGSHGEGGGQILRTAVAMSAMTAEPVKITDIRANRPNPGLSHQHMMAIKAAETISEAEVDGLEKGSQTVTFKPSTIQGGQYKLDIGTAGSITLLLQAVIPPALMSDERTRFIVQGGTDVKWSPPYDYFENVFLQNLRNMGCDVESTLERRGHYPKGGGKAEIEIRPGTPTSRVEGEVKGIRGKAFVTDLPDHIAQRMRDTVKNRLDDLDVNIETERYSSDSPGTALTLWTEEKVLGAARLGEKGVSAEEIGKDVAEELKKDIELGADIDIHMADQIIPYLQWMKESGELKVREKTGHLETNVWVVNQFTDKNIKIDERDDGIYIVY